MGTARRLFDLFSEDKVSESKLTSVRFAYIFEEMNGK